MSTRLRQVASPGAARLCTRWGRLAAAGARRIGGRNNKLILFSYSSPSASSSRPGMT